MMRRQSVLIKKPDVGDMKKKLSHQCLESTVSMLTFFAALCQKCVNSPSLKLSVAAIIDDAETVGTNSQRANVGDMKKITIASIP
jgi:hypothetical protein